MEKARQKPKNSGMEINLPKLPIGKDQTENFRLIFLVWKLPYRKVQTPDFGLEGKEYWPCVVFNNREYDMCLKYRVLHLYSLKKFPF